MTGPENKVASREIKVRRRICGCIISNCTPQRGV